MGKEAVAGSTAHQNQSIVLDYARKIRGMREVRDDLIETVLAYMRREISSHEFDECMRKLTDERTNRDKSSSLIHQMLWLFYDDFTDHPVSISREGWDLYRRCLAFLRTDFELESVRHKRSHPRQFPAAVSLVILLAAITASVFTGWWLVLALAWLVIGLAWEFHFAKCRERSWPALERAWRLAPFRSEEQWGEYEHVLDRLEIPDYDPMIHSVPWKQKPSARFNFHVIGPIMALFFLPIRLLYHLFPDVEYVALIKADE